MRTCDSAVPGPKGNVEHFVYARARAVALPPAESLTQLIAKTHPALKTLWDRHLRSFQSPVVANLLAEQEHPKPNEPSEPSEPSVDGEAGVATDSTQ